MEAKDKQEESMVFLFVCLIVVFKTSKCPIAALDFCLNENWATDPSCNFLTGKTKRYGGVCSTCEILWTTLNTHTHTHT